MNCAGKEAAGATVAIFSDASELHVDEQLKDTCPVLWKSSSNLLEMNSLQL